MDKPKILYALQGTGNGHVARANALLPELQKYFDVDVLLAGHQSEVSLPITPKWQLRGLVFYYTNTGTIDYWKTLWRLRLRRFFLDAYRLPLKSYAYVLNDFESVTAYACKWRKVPCLGLSHQAAVLAPEAPKPSQKNWVGNFILKHYAPTKQALGFHFKKWGSFVMAPVIRNQIVAAQPTDNDFYLVYLPAFSAAVIREFLAGFPKTTFHIFHKSIEAAEVQGKQHWHPISGDLFATHLVQCTGVLTSAGFETPAEALYLKKKLLVVPIKGQYEQACNAAGLKALGVPVMLDLDYYEMAKWIRKPQRNPQLEIAHPAQVVQQVRKVIGQGLS